MLRLPADAPPRPRRPSVQGPRSSVGTRQILALAGAILAATLELTAAHAFGAGGLRPHFVLVLVALLAIAVDVNIAVVAALAGGIALDALAFRPLGVTALGLLVGAGVLSTLISPLGGARRAAGVVIVIPWAVAINLMSAVSAGVAIRSGRVAAAVLDGAIADAALVAIAMTAWLLLRKRGATELPATP